MTAVVTLSGTVYGNFILESGEGFAIGRSLQADLSVDDLRVSRRHCQIQSEAAGVTLTDLRSANGTYLNGRRITKAVLRPGDRLQIGSAELQVQVSHSDGDYLDRNYICSQCGRSISLMTFAEGDVVQLDGDRFICPQCLEKQNTPEFSLLELDMIKRLHQEGFEVLEKLSISGVVPIYKARKTTLDQLVALKALPLAATVSKKKISRFAQEAKTQARLRHRNIVSIYDVRQTQGLVYIVMELIEGETLLQTINRSGSRLAVKDAIRYVYQIARALAHAFEKGIIHRDIKPSNIMVAADGDAKLIDFGLAKNLYEVTMSITADGETLGTIGYMAPEQVGGAKGADHRADIYALGATLFHCLAGRPPFRSVGEIALLEEIKRGPPMDALVGVPLSVVSLIARAMQIRPEDRFQTPAELLRAIETVVAEITGIQADARNAEFLLKVRDEESDMLQTWRISARRRTSNFLGSFSGSELVEFVQMLEFNAKSGVLNIAGRQMRGRILVREGRIVRAETSTTRGAQAVGQLLLQQQGDFEFTPADTSSVTDLNLPIGHALMEVMRYRDESGRLGQQR